MKPSKDPSIQNEPQMHPQVFRIDPVDPPVAFEGQPRALNKDSEEDVQHSVWDEPGLSNELSGSPSENDLTYANWLEGREAGWSQGKAWLVTFIVAILSGPLGLLLVAFNGLEFNRTSFISVCLFAPLVQEICKNAIALWVVERRPYFFTGWFQIFFCSLASGTIFVIIINSVWGLFGYQQQPSELVIAWMLFLPMHLATSTLVATGLEKIWRRVIFLRQPPRLEHGFRWFVAAIVLNVVYSTGVFVYELFQ